jgi:hypothetical protein
MTAAQSSMYIRDRRMQRASRARERVMDAVMASGMARRAARGVIMTVDSFGSIVEVGSVAAGVDSRSAGACADSLVSMGPAVS